MRTRTTLELLQATHYRNIPVFVGRSRMYAARSRFGLRVTTSGVTVTT